MFPVNLVQYFRIAHGIVLFLEGMEERVVDLHVQDLLIEVALFECLCTSRRREKPLSVLLFLSSRDICLQYCQSWRGRVLWLLLRGPVVYAKEGDILRPQVSTFLNESIKIIIMIRIY